MIIKYGNKKVVITLPWTARITMVLANFAIVSSVFYAAWQYETAKKHNKLLFTIDTINRFYNKDFFKSTSLIHTLHYQSDTNTEEFIDAANYVFNNYYLISIVFHENIANNDIIEKAVKNELEIYLKSNSFKRQKNKYVRSEIIRMHEIMNQN